MPAVVMAGVTTLFMSFSILANKQQTASDTGHTDTRAIRQTSTFNDATYIPGQASTALALCRLSDSRLQSVKIQAFL